MVDSIREFCFPSYILLFGIPIGAVRHGTGVSSSQDMAPDINDIKNWMC